ncbi:Forkhead box protein J2 [Sparganum proliferum]
MSLRRPLPPVTNLPEISGQGVGEGSGPKVLSVPVASARRSSVYTSGQSEGHLNCFGHFQPQFSADADQERDRASESVDFKLERRKSERATDTSGRNLTLEAGSVLFQKQNDSCFRAPLQAPQDASSRTKRPLVRKPVAEDEDEQGCADLNTYFSRLYSIVFSQLPGETLNFSGSLRHEGGDAESRGHSVEFPEEAGLSSAKRSRPSAPHYGRPMTTTDDFTFSPERSGAPSLVHVSQGATYPNSCPYSTASSSGPTLVSPNQRVNGAQRTVQNGVDRKYLSELNDLNGSASELASRLRRNLWLATEYDWTTVPSKATEYFRNLLQQLTPPKELISVQNLCQINSDLERIFVGGFSHHLPTNPPVSDHCDCRSEHHPPALTISSHQPLPRIQDSFGPAAPKSDSNGCDGQLNTFPYQSLEFTPISEGCPQPGFDSATDEKVTDLVFGNPDAYNSEPTSSASYFKPIDIECDTEHCSPQYPAGMTILSFHDDPTYTGLVECTNNSFGYLKTTCHHDYSRKISIQFQEASSLSPPPSTHSSLADLLHINSNQNCSLDRVL